MGKLRLKGLFSGSGLMWVVRDRETAETANLAENSALNPYAAGQQGCVLRLLYNFYFF